jgi:hypothetical protein
VHLRWFDQVSLNIAGLDPELPDASGRFEAIKNADFPINERWRQCAI